MESLKTKKSFTFSKGKEIEKEKEIKFQITNNQNTADTTNKNNKKRLLLQPINSITSKITGNQQTKIRRETLRPLQPPQSAQTHKKLLLI